jgi:membrane protein implicated in regulation of membrane protease activity
MMGISALLVGLVSLLLPQLSIQILLWIGCSTLLIFWVPRWFPTSKPGEIRETLEAQTISAIPAGQTGRVLFEGNSWRARCADPQAAIAPNQKVYVVRREGTTLVVLPEDSVS